jgi:hypothetical protein
MSQAESRLSRRIMQALEAEGIFCFKVHGGATMMSGLPDIVACVHGHFVGLETKLPGNEGDTSTVQKLIHGKIRKAKGAAEVVTSVDQALEICRAFYP